MLLRDQLADLGHQIVRHIHDGLGRPNADFILSQCLVLGLLFIVGKDPLYLLLVWDIDDPQVSTRNCLAKAILEPSRPARSSPGFSRTSSSATS